jgi:hypothetical protein
MSTNTKSAIKRAGLTAAVLALGALGGLAIGGAADSAAGPPKPAPASASASTIFMAPPPAFTRVWGDYIIRDWPRNVPFIRPTIHML